MSTDLVEPRLEQIVLTAVPTLLGRIESPSVESLASVGNATAFGCTVVSTITLEKSEGLAAPVRVAAFRLSRISAMSDRRESRPKAPINLVDGVPIPPWRLKIEPEFYPTTLHFRSLLAALDAGRNNSPSRSVIAAGAVSDRFRPTGLRPPRSVLAASCSCFVLPHLLSCWNAHAG
jgi:hypothetical protein